MQLYLLDLTFEAQNQSSVESWLAQADLKGGLLSVEQYDDQVLALLVSKHILIKELIKTEPYSSISFGHVRRSAVYRMITDTKTSPSTLIQSFPLQIDEEWYLGDAHTAYLCLPSPMFSDKQLSWLAACSSITSWDAVFEIPTMVRRGIYSMYR